MEKRNMQEDLSSAIDLVMDIREIEKKDKNAVHYIRGFVEGVKVRTEKNQDQKSRGVV
ncbi:MAG: hypothetical protein HFF36_10565 [Coprobacillus sp.]|nr:hypothetical protein [Coprobacillus sp.]